MDVSEKDTNQTPATPGSDKDVVLYKSIGNGLFSGSQRLSFIYVKAEKLACAAYLVTELLPEGNPLKSKIRSRAIELISTTLDFALSLRSRFGIDAVRHKELAGIEEMVSLCRVALASPGASRMNFSLLEREYAGLLAEVVSVSGVEAVEDLIPKGFLDVAIPVSQSPGEGSFLMSGSSALSDKPPMPTRVNVKGMSYSSSRTDARKNASYKKAERQGQTNPKNDRVETVLKVVKERGAVGIREISRAIPDCSEKTVQRLLADLVSQGTLKKQGERRWSIYSLIK